MTSVGNLVTEELFKTRQQFFSEYPNRNQLQEFRQLQQEWQPRLLKEMDETDAQAFIIEDFLFSKKPALWQEFIVKQAEAAQRPTTKEVLASWTDVEFFLGRYMGGDASRGELENALTGKTYTMTDEPPTDMDNGQGLIAILLPDPRAGENGRLFLNGYLTVVGDFAPFLEQFNLAASAAETDGADYLSSHYLSAIETAVKYSNAAEKEEDSLPDDQKAVMEELDKHLNETDYSDETKEHITSILSSYLQSEKPAVQKPETLVAGFWRFLQDRKMIEGSAMTQKELSEKFGVSAGTILKRSKEFTTFFEQRLAAEQK